MYALDPTLAAPRCPPLADVAINTLFARSVLEGCQSGRLWTDDTNAPKAFHVVHSYGMSLIWGADVEAALPALTVHLRAGTYREKDEWLQIDPRWDRVAWDDALGVGRGTAQRFTRVNFRFDKAIFLHQYPTSQAPNGWMLAPMDADTFATKDVSVAPTAFWPNAKAFLTHGGGIAAMRDGHVGAIAFSAMRLDDLLEIGIETLAPFRGKGLARAVAVDLIHHCLAWGLTPVWSCRKENTGSYRLAQTLGFVPTIERPFYRLPTRQHE